MGDPTFQIPKDVIEPIIQAHVTSAVVAALGNRDEIVKQAVVAVLNRKVDENGKDSTYSYATTWLQWAMRKCLCDAVMSAMTLHLENHKKNIEKYLVDELKRKNSPMLKGLIEGMLGAVTHPNVAKYRLTITLDDKS